ncbi:voltage-gated hydrogen channel 1 [Bombina bombina]|uniref:voltage-gated hydrogen channel 1 n=1 Tax=Bombina bombina TaxID=8345 RepID=UPI00235B1EDC|nr:voltage-gated hydrogen channel 1 [Bombina bombina]XP_053557697.1 voltage-gated hydrogen channel 1 [Bombina bombina]XP_053557698.1 voltage-gated hydrogen channel 1 [Bombina bombina]
MHNFTTVGDELGGRNLRVQEEIPDIEAPKTPHPFFASHSFRGALKWLLSSHKFQILIVCLVVFDALLVVIEIVLDLEAVEEKIPEIVPEVFHYMSVSVLAFFILEILVKLYAFRLEFFHHKFEVFDAVIVIISFVIDVVFIARHEEFSAVGLLILLRLWRVVRIINGVIVSIKAKSEEKVGKLQEDREALLAKVNELEHQCAEKEEEIARLEKVLTYHKIVPANE